MTHLDDVTLSAFSDGELERSELEAAKLHLAACTRCSSRLEKLKAASAAFRRSGAEKLPEGLSERAKAHAKSESGSRGFPWELVAVLGTVALVVLVSGAMLKKFMPSLFNNTQTMITGAAGQMGQGDEIEASTGTSISRSTETTISPSTSTVRAPRPRKRPRKPK